jgi:hypothetical protein
MERRRQGKRKVDRERQRKTKIGNRERKTFNAIARE